jgi:hypothetical protein
MKWKKTNDILDKILRRAGGATKDEILDAWNKLEESKIAEVITFTNGTLILKVPNSAYLQMLSFKREEIKKNLNKILGNKIVNVKLKCGG